MPNYEIERSQETFSDEYTITGNGRIITVKNMIHTGKRRENITKSIANKILDMLNRKGKKK
jgi:hypothetical protein